jgi:hypothetical protein
MEAGRVICVTTIVLLVLSAALLAFSIYASWKKNHVLRIALTVVGKGYSYRSEMSRIVAAVSAVLLVVSMALLAGSVPGAPIITAVWCWRSREVRKLWGIQEVLTDLSEI